MLKEYLTHKYQTSKDYNRLFDLMLNEVGRIVCFVKQKGVQDVCQTSSEPIIKLEDGEKIYNFSVGARGISYINAIGNTVEEYRKDFISQCEDCNLEFIDMQEATKEDIRKIQYARYFSHYPTKNPNGKKFVKIKRMDN